MCVCMCVCVCVCMCVCVCGNMNALHVCSFQSIVFKFKDIAYQKKIKHFFLSVKQLLIVHCKPTANYMEYKVWNET